MNLKVNLTERRLTREEKFDVTFIFADEKITNMHIMKKIETFIRGSDFSIFDISGWNPNVTLELGFAMAATEQWYIAIDPSKTEIKEVPSRADVRALVKDHPGLTIISIAQLLSVEVTVAQLIVKPLLESGELETTGVRRGTKYYPARHFEI